jgi:hypothetical protein
MEPPRKILTDPDDYILDLSSPSGNPPAGNAKPAGPASARPFLSIHFKCCNVYNRIYKNPAGEAYVGHCPRCARQLRVPIGPGGSTNRSFVAE